MLVQATLLAKHRQAVESMPIGQAGRRTIIFLLASTMQIVHQLMHPY